MNLIVVIILECFCAMSPQGRLPKINYIFDTYVGYLKGMFVSLAKNSGKNERAFLFSQAVDNHT